MNKHTIIFNKYRLKQKYFEGINSIDDLSATEIFEYFKYLIYPFQAFYTLNEFLYSENYDYTCKKINIKFRKLKINKICSNLKNQ